MARDPVRLAVAFQLKEGGFVRFDEERAHYLRTVMRLREGEEVRLFNGTDGEFKAVLHVEGKKGMGAETGAAVAPPDPPSPFSLWISPLKPACEAFALQKAVELGAGAVAQVLCRRSRNEGSPEPRRRRIAEEAAEQCGRCSVPVTSEPFSLTEGIRALPPAAALIWCDETGTGVSAPAWPQSLPARGAVSEYIVLIGPEGGFDPEERALLAASPSAYPVSLGPRVLKAETAAVCALTLCQLYFGDWDGRPRYRH